MIITNLAEAQRVYPELSEEALRTQVEELYGGPLPKSATVTVSTEARGWVMVGVSLADVAKETFDGPWPIGGQD